mmetsp:Transcript_39178/g.99265  ORF Transcript_39178/g.99265 Transcript_39178/m.99265 type:complete len:142 (-) Transcript_39178:160-585(-)
MRPPFDLCRYEDEYQLEDIEVTSANYIKPTSVANFRKTWEELDTSTEREDDYGLGHRDALQDAVESVIGILGMQPCEGTDAVPPNSRSHTVLLAGTVVGYQQVLVRMNFGIDSGGNVAMKLCVRSEDEDISDAIHHIIQEA